MKKPPPLAGVSLDGINLTDPFRGWSDVVDMLAARLPLSEGQAIALGDVQPEAHRARLQMGLLAYDIRDIPFAWPKQSATEADGPFQRPQLTLEYEESWDERTTAMMAALVPELALSLQCHLKEVPDLYFRDACELYNVLFVRLAEALGEEWTQTHVDAYVIDPRFPSTLTPILAANVPDDVKTRQVSRMQRMIWYLPEPWCHEKVAPWRDRKELVRRYFDMALERLRGGSCSPMELHAHLVFLVAEGGANLDVYDLERAFRILRSDSRYDDFCLDLARHIFLEEQYDWCPGAYIHLGEMNRLLRAVGYISAVLLPHEDVHAPVRHVIGQIQRAHTRRESPREQPEPVVTLT